MTSSSRSSGTTGTSKIFVARLVDNNNLERGDPIKFIDVSIVDIGFRIDASGLVARVNVNLAVGSGFQGFSFGGSASVTLA